MATSTASHSRKGAIMSSVGSHARCTSLPLKLSMLLLLLRLCSHPWLLLLPPPLLPDALLSLRAKRGAWAAADAGAYSAAVLVAVV